MGLIVLTGLAALLGAAPPSGAEVQIPVTKVGATEGLVHVELCPGRLSLKTFPYVGEAHARQGTTLVVVPGVPPGRFAAQGLS